VTEQTVKFHLTTIYRTLGVANHTSAARAAYGLGLLVTPSGGNATDTIGPTPGCGATDGRANRSFPFQATSSCSAVRLDDC
jgi:hypothetical protein